MLNKNTFISFLFKFFHRPLTLLPAACILITASARLSFAIDAALCLLFVCFFSAIISRALRKNIRADGQVFPLLPEKGRKIAAIFITNFAGSLFIFFHYLSSPLFALETMFTSLVIPVFALCEDVCEKYEDKPIPILIKNCLLDAAYLGLLVIAVSLVREPLGYAALTLPGGIKIFNKNGDFPFALEIVSYSSGAFLLVGFIMVIFRVIDRRKEERK